MGIDGDLTMVLVGVTADGYQQVSDALERHMPLWRRAGRKRRRSAWPLAASCVAPVQLSNAAARL